MKIEPVYFDFENRLNDQPNKRFNFKKDKIDILVNNASSIETSLFEMTKISNMKKILI